jgi:mono/diheme cytochrome c family protein
LHWVLSAVRRGKRRFECSPESATAGLSSRGLACCVLMAAASLAVPARAQIQSERSGAELFQGACSTCHAADGRGNPTSQVGFDLPLPDFTDCDFASREPDLDWLAIVHEGGPARGFNRMMPAFADALSDEQIAAVVEHVRSFCGDDSWPRGDLNLPLALFTEKAYPEDEAVITTTVTEGAQNVTQQYVWEQRFGRHSQVELSLPLIRADLGSGAGWRTGIGDFAAAIKHVLKHDLGRGSILSVGSEVVFATGDESRGFGSGSNILEPFVAFGKMLPRDSFIQVFGFAELPLHSELEDEIGARAALGRTWYSGGPFGRAWTPMVEVLAARELASGADIQWDVVPQFQVSLSARQHIMANLGVRLPVSDSSQRDTQVVFYLLWDWYDGGLLEGW